MAGVKKLSSSQVFEIKVELEYTSPLVWRTFQVYDSINMLEFHRILQVVMGWMNSHLFCFEQKNLIIQEDDEDGFFEMTDRKFLSAQKTKLRKILSAKGHTCWYLYDFGDSWKHKLTLKRILSEEDVEFRIPRCIAGENACPPEDCGGIFDFEHLKQTLSDPEDENHLDILHWLDDFYPNYDPSEFSLGQINKALKIGGPHSPLWL